MKKLLILCSLLMSLASLVWAGTANDLTSTPYVKEGIGSDASYDAAKVRYYELFSLVEQNFATASERTELGDLCQVWGFDMPVAPESEGRDTNPLDNGGPDCDNAVAISGCPFTDSGNWDGDNDCSVPVASPNNEVFYSFVAPADGYYQFRARNYGTGVPAIRVMSGACCTGGVSVAYSASSVATDCGEPTTVVTYLRATLVAGTQYWIHVGTSSTTASTAAYDFSLYCIPCPTNVEPDGFANNTCATALTITLGDSLLADSAYATGGRYDWFTFTKTGYDTVRFFVGGREMGHCVSGLYPSTTGPDGRFTIFRDNGSCPGDSIVKFDDEGCSYDAVGKICVGPGTYYMKVWNYNDQPYILSTSFVAPCPAPLDCATFPPCGTPAEIEPNNGCDFAANFLTLACSPEGPADFYGTICPQTDADMFYVAPAAGVGEIVIINLYQGDNCDLQPLIGSGLVMKGATGTGGICSTPTGTSTYRYVLGTYCSPFTGGYIGVVRAAGPEAKYRISVRCSTAVYTCPNVQVPNQHAAGPCVGGITTDYAWHNFTLDVPIQYHITDLNVRLDLTHTFDGDLDIYLVTPWADTLELSTDNGSGSDNYTNTVFDDEGDSLITAGHAPFTGSYIPEELLAGADGNNAQGTWTLAIYDDAGGDLGYVFCWALEFEYDYILAVEMQGGFVATAGDGSVSLAWATASETDNARFEIVRNGATVGSVEGAGNSATRRDYTFVDENLRNGTTYRYALVAVDLAGERTELATASATPAAGVGLVTEYALYQNYPNPFNPTTNISFDLVESGFVTLKVYNLMGQMVANVVSGQMGAGKHTVSFDASNLSSGIYLYRIEANSFAAEKKMLLMK